jgi:succinate-acetate transporter protein
VNDAGEPIVFGLAFAYGGLAQVLAGMWEFKNNNTFGATAFTSFGAFWISFFVLEQFEGSKIPAANLGDAVGLYLIAWGIFTAYMWVASFRVSAAVMLVFALLTVTFIVLGIGEASGTESIVKAGGWIGIATAIAAWYASFASVTNKTFGRIVLPVREFK